MLRQEHLKQVNDDYNNNNDNKMGKHQQKRIGISNKFVFKSNSCFVYGES